MSELGILQVSREVLLYVLFFGPEWCRAVCSFLNVFLLHKDAEGDRSRADSICGEIQPQI